MFTHLAESESVADGRILFDLHAQKISLGLLGPKNNNSRRVFFFLFSSFSLIGVCLKWCAKGLSSKRFSFSLFVHVTLKNDVAYFLSVFIFRCTSSTSLRLPRVLPILVLMTNISNAERHFKSRVCLLLSLHQKAKILSEKCPKIRWSKKQNKNSGFGKRILDIDLLDSKIRSANREAAPKPLSVKS